MMLFFMANWEENLNGLPNSGVYPDVKNSLAKKCIPISFCQKKLEGPFFRKTDNCVAISFFLIDFSMKPSATVEDFHSPWRLNV